MSPAQKKDGSPSDESAHRLGDDDERYFVVSGRRWRRTDPAIPGPLRTALVNELMSARRAVKSAMADADEAAEKKARARVQDAKTALGERGAPWWDEPSPADRKRRVQASILALLRSRREGATICPSEAARIACQPEWRDHKDLVREVVWRMVDEGMISVRQKGRAVGRDARGAIRLGLEPAPRS